MYIEDLNLSPPSKAKDFKVRKKYYHKQAGVPFFCCMYTYSPPPAFKFVNAPVKKWQVDDVMVVQEVSYSGLRWFWSRHWEVHRTLSSVRLSPGIRQGTCCKALTVT